MPSGLAGDGSALARRLLEVAGDRAEGLGHPIWVLVRALPGGDAELAVRADDFDGLGWVAPPEWDGMGVVGTGRLRRLDESVELPAAMAPGLDGGLRMACLVFRSGAVGWHMTLPDGSSFEEVPEEGRMLDILRRCLGLPTPPPPPSLEHLYNLAWMAEILDAAVPGRLLSWSDVLALHPVLLGHRDAFDSPTRECLIDILTSRDTWEDVRVAAADGFVSDPLPAPHLAAWMDSGMFARWVLSAIPPAEETLAEVRRRLRPSAARRLAHRLRGAA